MTSRPVSCLVSGRIVVEAAPATVFAILADPRQHPRIDGSGSVRGLLEGPDVLTRGATFGVRMKLFGVPYRITNRVVEHETDRLIAWRHFGGHRWRYELTPGDDAGPGSPAATEVTETFDYSRYGPVWRRLLELAGFPERNRRGIEETLRRLKAAAESDEAARATDVAPAGTHPTQEAR